MPAKRTASVTDRLRDDILSGLFPPGDRLVETQLGARYGVGRAAVRSALLELDREGLVDRRAHRGAAVRRISIEEAIEIAEARSVLEGLVARRAADVANSEERTELESIVAEMTAAVTSGERRRYSELNRRLHRRLREMSRHSVAQDLVANLEDRGAHHQFHLALMPGRSTDSLREHAAIVSAVVAGDAAGAERAMHRHLASVAAVLKEWSEVGFTA
ncbi:MAG: GntR family transcriptional regulator [Acidimicrobiales bacterium]